MRRSMQRVAAFAVLAVMAACANDATGPEPTPAVALKGGVGGGGGGGSVGSVTPSFTGKVDSMGVIPLGFYYGNPTQWWIGGRRFQSLTTSRFKPLAGPIVVGACVNVSYTTGADGVDYFSDLKSEVMAACDAAANGGELSGKNRKKP